MKFIILHEPNYNEEMEINPKHIGMMRRGTSSYCKDLMITHLTLIGLYTIQVSESIEEIKNMINNLED